MLTNSLTTAQFKEKWMAGEDLEYPQIEPWVNQDMAKGIDIWIQCEEEDLLEKVPDTFPDANERTFQDYSIQVIEIGEELYIYCGHYLPAKSNRVFGTQLDELSLWINYFGGIDIENVSILTLNEMIERLKIEEDNGT